MPRGSVAEHGHTLVELLTTLGLIALLASIATPSFAGWLLDLRRDATVAAALHAVNVARQLAAQRGEPINLCGAGEDLRCNGLTEWSAGLLVAPESAQPPRHVPVPGAASLRSNRNAIRFEAGTGHASPATLSICDRRGPDRARTVVVSRSGRPRATDPGTGTPAC